MNTWFNETLDESVFDIGARTSIKIGQTLFEGQSEYQKLVITDTPHFGRMMILDDCIMLTESHEYIYHEMLAHVPLFSHPNPERVLIIGGGDGGTAREVLKHPLVQECVMVEIDALVIEKSKEFFPQFAPIFNHPRLTLLIQDGIQYIKDHQGAFDIILVDSTDPVGPAEGLFSKTFYEAAWSALKADGLLVTQAESPFYFQKVQKELFKILRDTFDYSAMYLAAIPFYPSGTWSFAFASKKYLPDIQLHHDTMKQLSEDFNYFNPEIYQACFALPNFVKKIIA